MLPHVTFIHFQIHQVKEISRKELERAPKYRLTLRIKCSMFRSCLLNFYSVLKNYYLVYVSFNFLVKIWLIGDRFTFFYKIINYYISLKLQFTVVKFSFFHLPVLVNKDKWVILHQCLCFLTPGRLF